MKKMQSSGIVEWKIHVVVTFPFEILFFIENNYAWTSKPHVTVESD